MPYVIGTVLALALAVFAAAVRLDRDRAFYTTVLIVVAHYYMLFGVVGGSSQAVMAEIAFMTVFIVVAVVGFKTNLWIVAAGLAGHGVFDALHGYVVTNTGVPAWWPAFCGSFDVVAGVVVGWMLSRGRFPASEARESRA